MPGNKSNDTGDGEISSDFEDKVKEEEVPVLRSRRGRKVQAENQLHLAQARRKNKARLGKLAGIHPGKKAGVWEDEYLCSETESES